MHVQTLTTPHIEPVPNISILFAFRVSSIWPLRALCLAQVFPYCPPPHLPLVFCTHSPTHTQALADRLLESLRRMHGAGYLHLDEKPSNWVLPLPRARSSLAAPAELAELVRQTVLIDMGNARKMAAGTGVAVVRVCAACAACECDCWSGVPFVSRVCECKCGGGGGGDVYAMTFEISHYVSLFHTLPICRL